MEREATFAQEHGLVFVIDIGKLGSHSCQIQALRRLIRHHAGMKFVVCHLLAPKQNELEEMSAALDSLAGPNVWFDLASLTAQRPPRCAALPGDAALCGPRGGAGGGGATAVRHRYPPEPVFVPLRGPGGYHRPEPRPCAEQKQAILYQNARTVFWGE